MCSQNAKKKYLFYIILTIVSILFCGLGQVCLFNIKSVSAEEKVIENQNYIVQTAENDPNCKVYFYIEKIGTNEKTKELIGNNKTCFIKSGESIEISFARKNDVTEDDEDTEQTRTFNTTATVAMAQVRVCRDGQEVSDFAKVSEIIDNDGNAHEYVKEKVSYVNLVEGKYEFFVSYNFIINAGTGSEIVTEREFEYCVYLIKNDTYNLQNGTPNVSYSVGMENVYYGDQSDIVAYERFFNYQKNTSGNFYVPTLTYNSKLFRVSISRTVEGHIYSYDLQKDASGAISVIKNSSDAPDLLFYTNGNDVIVTMKDLGVYNIFYKYIYTIGNQEIELEIMNEVKKDILHVYGYQAYYSDYEEDLKEFRSVNNFAVSADVTTKDCQVSEADNVITISNLPDNIISTNQAPVRFKFNVNIKIDESECYKLSSDNKWEEYGVKTNFTEVGTYFVKYVYCYDQYKYQTGIENYNIVTDYAQTHTQCFCFTISAVTPVISIKNTSGQTIYSNQFTKEDVVVKIGEIGEFDSKVKVFVKKANFSDKNIYISSQEVLDSFTFNESGKYVVETKFGKNYTKTNYSYFVIDKEEISGMKANVVTMADYTDIYVKTKEILDLYTNTQFALSWKEKQSGALVKADYVLVPLIKSTTNILSPSMVDENTHQEWISNGTTLNWTGVENLVPYTNTLGKTAVSGSEILNEAGLYLFRIYDEAGWEAYYYVFLDNSENKFLQKKLVDGENYEYFEPSALNNVANDTIVEWGSHKIISINGITTANVDKENIGRLKSFFEKYLENKEVVDTLSGNIIFKNKITDVFVVTDLEGAKKVNGNSYEVKVLKDGIPNEQVYKFYTVDSANYLLENKTNFDTYNTNRYSGYHSIKVSTDMSKSMIIDSNQLQYDEQSKLKINELEQYGSGIIMPLDPNEIIDINTNLSSEYVKLMSLKNYYYTNQDVLYFAHIKEIDQDIRVDDIICNFYPLEYNQLTKSYEYATVGTPITINFDLWTEYNSVVGDGSQYYIGAINPVENGLTKSGKYSIVRQYIINSEEDVAKLSNQYDYVTREYVFFVDRNPILTGPSVHGTEEELSKDVGEYIRTYVLFGQEDQILFDAFYRQSQVVNRNDLASISPILITNKLPVKIYIPMTKYGYDNEGIFTADNVNAKIITSYSDGGIVSTLHPNLYLRAKITFKNSQGALSVKEYTNLTLSNGYLDISEYTERFGSVCGNYYIEIFDGMGNLWFFSFEVREDAPKMTFVALSNGGDTKTNISNSAKYTNADGLRVEWTDPIDNYLAKIDAGHIEIVEGREIQTSAIYYTINGTRYDVMPSDIMIDDSAKYFNIWGKLVNGQLVELDDGDKIVVYAHYEGNASDYPSGSYYYQREINIDYTAPVSNLNRLLDGVIIKSVDEMANTRIIGKKYNKTINTGDMAYYAYAISTDFIFSMSSNTNEAATIKYRAFNDKYNSEVQETNLPTDPESTGSNMYNSSDFLTIGSNTEFSRRKQSGLYEIVEIDSAGNYTVYTVYLYNSEEEKLAVTYDCQLENNRYQELDNAEGEISVFNSFTLKDLNINGDQWWNIKITKNGSNVSQTFRRTPVLINSEVFIGGTSQKVQLKNAYNFENNNKYTIEITDRQSKTIKVLTVYISNMSRRFDVEFNKIENGFEILIKNDDILKINGIPSVWAGTLQGSSYLYDELDYEILNTFNSTKLTVYYDDLSKLFKLSIPTNFSTIQNFYYVVGQTQVDDEITGEDLITTDSYYDVISSHDVSFTYNNLLYSVMIGYGADSYVGQFSKVDNGNLSTITLHAGSFVYGLNDYVGDDRVFTLTISSLISEEGEQTENRILNIRINNKMPKINLFNDYGENQNVLFSGGITKQPVIIKFNEIDNPIRVYLKKRNSDNEAQLVESGLRIYEYGDYELTCVMNSEFTASYTKYFTITQSELSIYAVVAKDSSDAEEFTYLDASKNFYTYLGQTLPFYITNKQHVEIKTDSSLNISVGSIILTSSDGAVTRLFTISNKNQPNQSTYIDEKIVVTTIPVSKNIVTNFYKIGMDGQDVMIEDLVSDKEIMVSTIENTIEQVSGNEQITLGWDPYYLEPNNKILITYLFNDIVIFENKELSSITLSSSGKHTLLFKDMAGNLHVFTQNIQQSNSFDFFFIKSVVFNVNDETPIDYAVYNGKVIINVPDESLKFYDYSSTPKLKVLKNGEEYEVIGKNRVWEIEGSGFYEVYFEAKWLGQYILKDPIHFSIINPNESRLAYAYSCVEKYEIQSVKKGDVEILSQLTNDSLKSLFTSCYDDQTGEGKYTITVKVLRNDTNMPEQSFSFSYWLHEAEPPIVVSVEQGTETKDVINVQFNVYNLYEEVGDCYVAINGFDKIYVNSSTLSNLEEIQSIDITKRGNYFIQVYTDNGNLVYSYRVMKKDPLNAVTIVLICLGAAVLVVLIVIYVKLRKKVKIR